MKTNETPGRRLQRYVIKAELRDDDYLIYVFNPRQLRLYKLTVQEWRAEGRAGQAFDRLLLAMQLMLAVAELITIPMWVSLLFSHIAYKWFFLLMLLFCVVFGPLQLIRGVTAVRWLSRHSKKIPRRDLNGGW